MKKKNNHKQSDPSPKGTKTYRIANTTDTVIKLGGQLVGTSQGGFITLCVYKSWMDIVSNTVAFRNCLKNVKAHPEIRDATKELQKELIAYGKRASKKTGIDC